MTPGLLLPCMRSGEYDIFFQLWKDMAILTVKWWVSGSTSSLMINWLPASAFRHPRATEQDAAAAETGQSGDKFTPSRYPCASLPPELLLIFTRDSLRPSYGAHDLVSFGMSDDDDYDLRWTLGVHIHRPPPRSGNLPCIKQKISHWFAHSHDIRSPRLTAVVCRVQSSLQIYAAPSNHLRPCIQTACISAKCSSHSFTQYKLRSLVVFVLWLFPCAVCLPQGVELGFMLMWAHLSLEHSQFIITLGMIAALLIFGHYVDVMWFIKHQHCSCFPVIQARCQTRSGNSALLYCHIALIHSWRRQQDCPLSCACLSRQLNPPCPSSPFWDLALVLKAFICSPFEPLHSALLKVLSFKTALSLALAFALRVFVKMCSFSQRVLHVFLARGYCRVPLKPRKGYGPKVFSTRFRAQVISAFALSEPAAGVLLVKRFVG